jgi:hypothetical protein
MRNLRMNPEEAAPDLSDTPAADRIWDGLVAWIGGTLAICGAAIAISAALGWPRRAAAALPGSELAFLIVQAVVCCAFVVRSGRSLRRRYPGAVAVAFAAGVPAALAVLMVVEHRDPSEPLATWGHLLVASVRFAALEAVPVGYLLWMLALRSPRDRN